MNCRMLLRGLVAVSMAALVGGLALRAIAQPVPVRVVQAGDGTVYLAQGPSGWPLVPAPIADSDLASVTLSGEIDGAIPPDLLSAPAAPMVVQAGDGALYVVQGGSAWLLVPAPIDDAELASLSLGGEINGAIPADLVSAPATSAATGEPPSGPTVTAAQPQPAQPAVAVPSPSSNSGRAGPSPVTAPGPTSCPVAADSGQPIIPPGATLITGAADLSGQTSNPSQPIPIAVGAAITSMLPKPVNPTGQVLYQRDDYYAVPLACGTKYTFVFSSSNAYAGGPLVVAIYAPDALGYNTYHMGNIQVHDQFDNKAVYVGDCYVLSYADNYYGPPQSHMNYDCTFIPPVTGTYVLIVEGQLPRTGGHASTEAQRYTFTVR